MSPRPEDRARVAELLGREPRGDYEVVVRDDAGDPVVLRNAPFLDDGTPMPTRYWLVGPEEGRRIGRLEAEGGVDAAEADIPPDELAAAHDRYAAERDAEIPADHTGPRPSGGVGGTRVGVKCLHAHWAWHLAGGDDPVGRWIESRLAEQEQDERLAPPDTPTIELGDTATTVRLPDGSHHDIPWGPVNLSRRWLSDDDPPRPEALTNALGAVTDHLDDILRARPDLLETSTLHLTGSPARALARLEIGADEVPAIVEIARDDAEEVFRMVATDTTADRAFHPGLPSGDVDTIVATCCITLAVLRRLHLDTATFHTGPRPSAPFDTRPTDPRRES